MAIFDEEKLYVHKMVDYLNSKKAFPFEIHGFTNKKELSEFSEKQEIEILLISETAFNKEVDMSKIRNTIILTEDGNLLKETPNKCIDKYQSAEAIIKETMDYYTGLRDAPGSIYLAKKQPKIIGVYSPVGRSLQTSYSLLLGQFLSRKDKAIYLNFEPFSGFGRIVKSDGKKDITDLIYFLKNNPEKFIYKLESIVQNVNGLDYIPPAFSFIDLELIAVSEWKLLLNQICRGSEYDYIILDLSDNIQGLFEILRICDHIYTITKDDGIALAKIEQYEKMLNMTEYADVLNKTRKFRFPIFRNLPIGIEQLPLSEMAEYVNKIIREDFCGEI